MLSRERFDICIELSAPNAKPLLVIYHLGELLRQGATAVGMIDIELTPRERKLLLRYGYPFDQIKQALLTASSSKSEEPVFAKSVDGLLRKAGIRVDIRGVWLSDFGCDF